jgi:hypothetical protein
MPNLLENSMIRIIDRGDYTCKIIPALKKYSSKQLYLIHSILNGNNYWAYYNKYIDKFRLCELITQPRFNTIIHKHYLNIFIPTNDPHNFHVYELSAKRFMVPNIYIIMNDKYNWDYYCDELNQVNELNLSDEFKQCFTIDIPIKKISHIKELTIYISSFL